MLRGLYPSNLVDGGIVASDCAAEVVAVGSAVTAFAVGDRVSPQMDIGNLTGEIEPTGHLGLGGEVDGVLREYAVFQDKVLVRIPTQMSWDEVTLLRPPDLTVTLTA
jgi:NADPH:quinone reductase-like Zn-dependent oxidoreductase